jgi:hypothetical protein
VKTLKKWAMNVLISIDQLGNTLAGGDPDETISSRLGKRKRAGTLTWFGRGLDRFLGWLDPGHSIDAIEDDEGKDRIIR